MGWDYDHRWWEVELRHLWRYVVALLQPCSPSAQLHYEATFSEPGDF
jgi:hypothetical protein